MTTTATPTIADPQAAISTRPTGVITIRPWPCETPTGTGVGHDPRSQFARRWWLPILGPGSWLAALHIRDGLDAHPDGFRLDLEELGRSIGMPGRSAIARIITRLDMFRLARWSPEQQVLLVRLAWPDLSASQRRRLPAAHLQARHQRT